MKTALLCPEAIVAALHTRCFGWSLYYFREIDSTNEYAKRVAHQGAEEGTVILADGQSRGKGRRGHTFFSPGGGLYLSVLLRPPLSPQHTPPLTLLAGVAAARSLRTLTGLPVELRWPNDLFLHQKKVGGILVEMELKEDQIMALIMGIGMNINTEISSFPVALRHQVTSVAHALHRPVSRELLCCSLLQVLEEGYKAFLSQGPAPILEAWKELSGDPEKEVRLLVGEEIVEGVLHGLDQQGNLLVAAGGQIRTIVTGEYL
jgi:BirA family biotin operon repressor/biotin-[acetyl-CoA-carboxylase] ligase